MPGLVDEASFAVGEELSMFAAIRAQAVQAAARATLRAKNESKAKKAEPKEKKPKAKKRP